jgi:ABC-2 type transport system permease protein
MFVSSLSKSPPLAAISSFIINFLLFWIADSEYIDAIANYLSLQKHFISLLSGAFSSIDIVYYLLITTMFIAMSIWRLDSLRTHQ